MANDFPTYTDMKRTRVIERGSVYTMPRENASIGSTQPITKKEGLLDGISVGQIAASAAAAATSMLLASKIGIAGSVIGAAVSSAVTIVATQLYRRALSMGARKLQNATFDAVHKPAGSYGAQETTQMESRTPYAQAYTSARSTRVAPTKLQARAAAQRANTQRKVIVASVAVAALSLALVSGAIMLATSGEGLGNRPDPIFTAKNETSPAAAEDQVTPEPKPASPENGVDANASKPETDGVASGSQNQTDDGGSAQTEDGSLPNNGTTSDTADTEETDQQGSSASGSTDGVQNQNPSPSAGTTNPNGTASSR